MTFEFATATRIIFGEGKGREVAPLARSWGRRVFVVTGWNTARCEWLMADLEKLGCEIVIFSVSGEPTIELAERGAEAARAHRSEVVIGLGGGSVIDAAKAIAVLVTNIEPVIDYLEVIGAGKQLEADPLPFIAVPTTAGTGAEVTRNAVLSSPEHQLKVSLRSPKMLPAIAVVDPELTYELPPEITAYTGLDALTQLIEPFLCSKANPLTDGICREAL
ncbi:MAG TPA: iron-containing alcohol dehydrogenase, partial [Candidatus Kapabacteria bacterium]|nr:iron-containing alcohol dehydrogenase [Candidatus Kapabacteria bacterium]